MHLVCPSCGATNRIADDRLGDQPVCGKCATALMAGEPVSLSEANFPKFVANTELPVLVDFWAEWCGPCKTMAPHFAAAARQTPKVRFAKLDVDAAPQAGAQYAIRSIPTMVLFKGGKEVARQSGAVSATQLAGWLRS